MISYSYKKTLKRLLTLKSLRNKERFLENLGNDDSVINFEVMPKVWRILRVKISLNRATV